MSKVQKDDIREMTPEQLKNDAYSLMVDLMHDVNFFYKENPDTGLDKYEGVVLGYAAITGDSTECHLTERFQLPHPDHPDLQNIPFTNGAMFAQKMSDEFFFASKATEKDYDAEYTVQDSTNGQAFSRTENLCVQLLRENLTIDDICEASKESHPEEFQKTDRDMTD